MKKKKKKDKVKAPPPKQRPMHDVDDLLDEAKYGSGLTTEELIYVVEKIKASKPGDNTDLYGLLLILGWADATQYRELVERFLYYLTDPMVSGMALKVLFIYWGDDAQRYLNEIKAFIKGVSWDEDEDLRLAAVHCTGKFLKKTRKKNYSNSCLISIKHLMRLSCKPDVNELMKVDEPNFGKT